LPSEATTQSPTNPKTTSEDATPLPDNVSTATHHSTETSPSAPISSPSTVDTDFSQSEEWKALSTTTCHPETEIEDRGKKDDSTSLPQHMIIAIIAAAVGVVVVILVITLIVHFVLKYKKSKAYQVTRSSEANANNNAPTALLKDSRIAEV
jgi:hypothetical protein